MAAKKQKKAAKPKKTRKKTLKQAHKESLKNIQKNWKKHRTARRKAEKIRGLILLQIAAGIIILSLILALALTYSPAADKFYGERTPEKPGQMIEGIQHTVNRDIKEHIYPEQETFLITRKKDTPVQKPEQAQEDLYEEWKTSAKNCRQLHKSRDASDPRFIGCLEAESFSRRVYGLGTRTTTSQTSECTPPPINLPPDVTDPYEEFWNYHYHCTPNQPINYNDPRLKSP